MSKNLLRELPSVNELIRDTDVSTITRGATQDLLTSVAREAIGTVREEILSGSKHYNEGNLLEHLASAYTSRLHSVLTSSLKGMVNATGTVLHTNLGRAPLCERAIEAVRKAAAGPVNLEFDLESGKRGERDRGIEELLTRVTGAEAACVVNNNAGAVLIALNALAEGREVIISRGELVEIGGSFRIPDVVKKSGCRLVEVGTTNRTHLKDYEEAAGDFTAILLKAHTSNYKVVGFTSSVPAGDLKTLASEKGIPIVEDLGSGTLIDLTTIGLPYEPTVGDSLREGVDVVTFSGDKLLGGPQCGIIVGKREYVDKIKSNPLKRALRCDKMTLAALEATLIQYLKAPSSIPAIRDLARPVEEIHEAAKGGARLLEGELPGVFGRVLGVPSEYIDEDLQVEVLAGEAVVGSGSMPGVTLPSYVITVRSASRSPEEIFDLFLRSDRPIVGRITDDTFTLDMRLIYDIGDILPTYG